MLKLTGGGIGPRPYPKSTQVKIAALEKVAAVNCLGWAVVDSRVSRSHSGPGVVGNVSASRIQKAQTLNLKFGPI